MHTQHNQTVVDIARQRAANSSDKIAYVNLRDGKEEHRPVSYGELDGACRRIGAALQHRNATGERVLLLLPQGTEFVVSFFGTLYGGAIAVPAHTPKLNKPSAATFEAIIEDCNPRFILTCHDIRDKIMAWSQQFPAIDSLEILCLEDLLAETSPDAWVEFSPAGTDTAFLQYTSGSTSNPKGVVVSHKNLVHNAALTARHMGHDEQTVIVSWLPLFHDLGLIGIVVQTLFVGATCYMMSPAAFSGNPATWLQAISRYRATTSMSSDFGYRLCVKSIRPEQLDGIDLSSWRNALNAAEPIYASTLKSFQERFAPYGFADDAFFPAYGLAEATLLSTTSREGENPVILTVDKDALANGEFIPVETSCGRETVDMVSSGRPADDMEIAIVDPDTQARCEDGKIGEVWVGGDSITEGYWQAHEASQRTFKQSPANGNEPKFLRTGDLGFVWNRELFVAGRLKDLIITRGRNIYPQDIELTVKDCHPAFRTVNGAAFSIEGEDGETIVVVHEIERTARNTTDISELIRTVRNAVWQEHEITLADVLVIMPASLPKTTSGKVQRRLTKSLYLSDGLKALNSDSAGANAEKSAAKGKPSHEIGRRSKTELETLIIKQAQALAGPSLKVRADDSFGMIGIDSVLAAQLVSALNGELGLSLDPTILWQYQTPELLAHHLVPEATETTNDNQPGTETSSPRDDLLAALRTTLATTPQRKQG